MSGAPNPFDELMRLGRDWAETMGQAATALTPEAMEKLWPTMPKEAMEAMFGKAFHPEGLDAKTRLLLTLHGLSVQGALAETQVRLTVRHLVEAGATPAEIRETVAMAGLFGGAAAMGRAMELANAVLSESESESRGAADAGAGAGAPAGARPGEDAP